MEAYMSPKVFMQAEIANAFIRKHKLTAKDFLVLDKKHNILQFIEKGYEPFHLMGNKGILRELEEACREE